MQDQINQLTDRAAELMAQGKRRAALRIMSRVGGMKTAMMKGNVK